MAISPVAGSNLSQTSNQQPSLSAREQAQKSQNSAIMQSHLDVSVKAGNKPLSLFYKTAVEAINKALEPALGENATQATLDDELDVSPEATAERIVQGATGFFGAFKKANPALDEESAMTNFMEVIRGGIEKGFEEAKGILDSLRVFEGEIESNIDLTYEHVQTGLSKFVDNYFKATE